MTIVVAEREIRGRSVSGGIASKQVLVAPFAAEL
jgi:hypothetical protein